MINKLLKEQTNNTYIQLFRSLLVSFVALAVDFGMLYVLTDIARVYFLISAGIAFLLGLSVNYFLSIGWVFKSSSNKRWIEFLLFSLIGLVGLACNELFIWIFTDKVHLHYLISKIVSTAIVYFWNFFARKFILFKGE